ncbi:hypothetical protein JEQ12_001652 [Ovis aries]|uniref:Serine/Arginine-related protein 53 n=1 Tax=Ovis aries TaxID=9940 RepID=A0A836AQX3_SHEEP|nr:hypothetical protein JEQ12_001652 [Ovis aries]
MVQSTETVHLEFQFRSTNDLVNDGALEFSICKLFSVLSQKLPKFVEKNHSEISLRGQYAKADEALKAKERNEEEAKRRKEEAVLCTGLEANLDNILLIFSKAFVYTNADSYTAFLFNHQPYLQCELFMQCLVPDYAHTALSHSGSSDQTTLVEQVKRVKEIEAIESDSFVQQTFRSSKEIKKSVEASEVKHAAATPGPASVVSDPPSTEKEIDPSSIPTAIKYQDDNSLAHPNLFIEKADAEEKWFKRLIALRQERLMGSPVA